MFLFSQKFVMKCLKMQVQIEMFIADELDLLELPAQAWSIKCTQEKQQLLWEVYSPHLLPHLFWKTSADRCPASPL